LLLNEECLAELTGELYFFRLCAKEGFEAVEHRVGSDGVAGSGGRCSECGLLEGDGGKAASAGRVRVFGKEGVGRTE
jgi:hypothetical protein